MTPQQNNFRTSLKLYRSIMTEGQRQSTKRKKLKPLIYPIGMEREYVRFISTFIDNFLNTITPYITRFLGANVRTRTDSVDSDLEALMKQLDDELILAFGSTLVTSGNLGHILSSIAEKLLGYNSAFMQKQIIIAAGTPITIDMPWWPEIKALWEQENYKLIKNLGTDSISKINGIIINGIQNGATIEELTARIQKVIKSMTGWRARFIARDQIGKLNSLVSRAQAESIGMETYYWFVQLDERLRGNPSGIYAKAIPSHFIMDGFLMAWNNPGVYSNDMGKTWKPKTGKMEPLHVGMAYLCRCTATHSWNSYLITLDKEIE